MKTLDLLNSNLPEEVKSATRKVINQLSEKLDPIKLISIINKTGYSICKDADESTVLAIIFNIVKNHYDEILK
ncbi:MAG: hypothetical protein RR922_07070, partial [Clostridia bacterium]